MSSGIRSVEDTFDTTTSLEARAEGIVGTPKRRNFNTNRHEFGSACHQRTELRRPTDGCQRFSLNHDIGGSFSSADVTHEITVRGDALKMASFDMSRARFYGVVDRDVSAEIHEELKQKHGPDIVAKL